MPDPARQERLEALFDALASTPPDQRDRLLATAAADDPALAAEAADLLRCLDASPAHLEQPALASAGTPGERIGHFRILRLLGEGGMGQVFEAQQDFPARRVALKVIRPGLVSDALLRRFDLEATALAQLKHPGIAAIYEAGSFEPDNPGLLHSRRPYFAMELIDGVPLDAFAAHADPRTTAAVLASVADAVHHAHEHGIIHRDLKPGNILVEGPGPAARPRILDFGVARLAADPSSPAATLATEAGQVLGTVAYMAPEVLRGEPADTRSDTYALGVILYRLLAGRLPFAVEGKGLLEAARAVLDHDPAPLRAARPDLPADLATIADKAMDRDRARRYSSAADLARDLRRFLADEPISARPATARYLALKFARRHRGLVAAAAALALTLAGSAAALAVLYRREQALRRTADDALATATREVARQKATLSLLVDDTFGAAAPSKKGHTLRVVDVLDDAANALPARFPDDAPLRAYLRVALGNLYDATAQPLKLRETVAPALDEAAADDTLTRAGALFLLGHGDQATGNDDAAIAHLRDAVDLATSALPDPSAANILAEARFALAESLQRAGRHDEADPILRTLIATDTRNTDRAIGLRLSLAASLNARNRPDDAQATLAEAVDLVHRAHREQSPAGLAALNNYANLLITTGRISEAAPIAVEVMNAAAKVFPPNHPNIAFASLTAAKALSTTGKHDEARAAADQALLIIHAAKDPADLLVERAESVAASIAAAANDPPRAADHAANALTARLLAAGPGDPELPKRASEYRALLERAGNPDDRLRALADSLRASPPGGPERKARLLANLALALASLKPPPSGPAADLPASLAAEARAALPASTRQAEDTALIDAAAQAAPR